MDKSELKNIPPRSFMAVVIAPVVVFTLANALFLPIIGALDVSRGGFLADLVASNYNPFIQNLILIIVSMSCLPLSAAAVLVGPALTSFLVNLKYPFLTSKSRATLCGGVFLAFHTILLVVLLIFRFIVNFQSIYGNTISLSSMEPSVFTPFMILKFLDPLPCLLSLAGIALSYSVAVAGRLGARKGSVNHKRAGSV